MPADAIIYHYARLKKDNRVATFSWRSGYPNSFRVRSNLGTMWTTVWTSHYMHIDEARTFWCKLVVDGFKVVDI